MQPYQMTFAQWKREIRPEVVKSSSRGGGFNVRSNKSSPGKEFVFYRTETAGQALKAFYLDMLEEMN